jgi:hypothetical protein
MKIIKIAFLVAFLSACSGRPTELTGLEGKTLPSFELFLIDSVTRFNTNNIPSGQPVVLFFFGPNCPYSRAEMGDIIANMTPLSKVRFYVFTTSPFCEMKSFYNYYHLNNFPNIVTGIDYTNFFAHYYKVPGVPYVAIYDKNKHLKRVFLGKTDIGNLKNSALD